MWNQNRYSDALALPVFQSKQTYPVPSRRTQLCKYTNKRRTLFIEIQRRQRQQRLTPIGQNIDVALAKTTHWVTSLFTARCYAERGNATASCPSVRPWLKFTQASRGLVSLRQHGSCRLRPATHAQETCTRNWYKSSCSLPESCTCVESIWYNFFLVQVSRTCVTGISLLLSQFLFIYLLIYLLWINESRQTRDWTLLKK